MEYLGIDFEFIYGADYNNLNVLKYFKPFCEYIENYPSWEYYTHLIGASYDHYTAVIHAYESGANSVLIMEDDCAFINDVSYIQWALNNYPNDADIVKFGYLNIELLAKNMLTIDFSLKNQYILNEIDKNINFVGCQMYSLCNKETIKKYIDRQQNKFECVDNIHSEISNKYYALVKPLAIDSLHGLHSKKYINEYNLNTII